MKTAVQEAEDGTLAPSWLRLVRGQVEVLRFGVVQIVVHNSRVVQIERTEKLRLDKTEPDAHLPGASPQGDLQWRLVTPAEVTRARRAPGAELTADQAAGGNSKP
jgi:hypothetical protein